MRFDGVSRDDEVAASPGAPCLPARLAGERQERFPRAWAHIDSSRNHAHQSPPMAGAQGEITTPHGLDRGWALGSIRPCEDVIDNAHHQSMPRAECIVAMLAQD